jgi:hypothetical protein
MVVTFDRYPMLLKEEYFSRENSFAEFDLILIIFNNQNFFERILSSPLGNGGY